VGPLGQVDVHAIQSRPVSMQDANPFVPNDLTAGSFCRIFSGEIVAKFIQPAPNL
jgi:hypothetical protein